MAAAGIEPAASRLPSKEGYLRRDRFIVGLICIALAIWMFLAGTTGGTVAPAIAVAILGIIMIAISRRG